jgi:hypothetical protein
MRRGPAPRWRASMDAARKAGGWSARSPAVIGRPPPSRPPCAAIPRQAFSGAISSSIDIRASSKPCMGQAGQST